MDGIKSTVLNKKDCEVSIKVEIDQKTTKQELEKIFMKIKEFSNIPGFRIGKAPIDLVKQNYSDKARNIFVEDFLPKVLAFVVEKEKLVPVVYPSISDFDFKEDSNVSFNILVETKPVFDPKDYKGIKVEKEKLDINDEEVEKVISRLRQNYGKFETAGDDVTKNSHIVMDYEGRVGETKFDGGAAKDAFLSIENSHFIPGFAEQLVGMKKGDTKDISVKFPDEYHSKDLAGKDANFLVTIKDVKIKNLPELNDEFAKQMGLTDIQDLKAKIKENLIKEKQDMIDAKVEKQIMDALLQKNNIAVPKTLAEDELKHIISNQEQNLKRQGMTFKTMGMDEAKLEEKYLPIAQDKVRLSFIMNEIANKEKVVATDEDIFAEKEKYLMDGKYDKKVIEDYFEKNKEEIAFKIREVKTYKFLLDNAKIKEVEKTEEKAK